VQNTHIKVPDGPPDDHFVYLSDVLPTAWQSVVYADVPQGGTLVVLFQKKCDGCVKVLLTP